MFITLMGMPLAEIINSAIERCVDLVTLHYHEMAKRAKDVGSAIVFLSIFIFACYLVFCDFLFCKGSVKKTIILKIKTLFIEFQKI